MRIDYLSSDILLYRGDSLASVATAFIDGGRVLLVDGLASAYDAIALREDLLARGKQVEHIVLTRAGEAHAKAVKLFPGVPVTMQRGDEEQLLQLAWGRHTLALFHAAGDPAGTLSIDVPDADLLFASERVVGAIAVLGDAPPAQLDASLARLQGRGRSRLVPGLVGAERAAALGHARHYLQQLAVRVARLRSVGCDDEIERLALEDLLAPGTYATPVERHWHRQNLARVLAAGWFPALRRTAAPSAWQRMLKRSGVGATLACMLGQLARRGV